MGPVSLKFQYFSSYPFKEVPTFDGVKSVGGSKIPKNFGPPFPRTLFFLTTTRFAPIFGRMHRDRCRMPVFDIDSPFFRGPEFSFFVNTVGRDGFFLWDHGRWDQPLWDQGMP